MRSWSRSRRSGGWSLALPTPIPSLFLPRAYRDLDELDGFLEHLAGEVYDRGFRALLDSLLADPALRAELAPGSLYARGHHAYLGGLLEHTVAVTTLAHETCQLHPRLNSDLLLTAAIVHDLGRTREFTYGAEIGVTDEGRMLGHLVIGERMLSERAAAWPRPVPPAALLHCVLCHHGASSAPGRPVRLGRGAGACTASTPSTRGQGRARARARARLLKSPVASRTARHGPGGPSSLQNWQGRAAPGLEGSIPSPRRQSTVRCALRSATPRTASARSRSCEAPEASAHVIGLRQALDRRSPRRRRQTRRRWKSFDSSLARNTIRFDSSSGRPTRRIATCFCWVSTPAVIGVATAPG